MTERSETCGTLYIVATPIGNLEDITLRALRILKEVDIIAAEDTRHTRKLLNHFAITTPLVSYYREKEIERSEEILVHLQEGRNVALVSDAGTPSISDPGAVVVRQANGAGLTVVPIPGPSAITTALSASGISSDGFLFLGFLAPKSSQRRKTLASVVNCPYPAVFYESPHRIVDFLSDALEIMGERQAFWARELTKSFEDLHSGSLSTLVKKSREGRNRGEFVVIICPGPKIEATGQTLEELILWYRDNSELSLKDVSHRLASDLGVSKTQVYQQALQLWNR